MPPLSVGRDDLGAPNTASISRRGAHCAPAPRGGIRSAYPLGQPGGRWKEGLTFARAARPEGRGGDSQEAGGTLVPPPLVCLRRIAANTQLWISSFAKRYKPQSPGRALCAPTRYGRNVWRAEVVAPYEIARQFTFSCSTKPVYTLAPGAQCAPLRGVRFLCVALHRFLDRALLPAAQNAV